MTQQQAEILLTLADIYVRLGRLDRGILIAGLVASIAPTHVEARRILARGYYAKGWPDRVLEQIDALVEHEFDSDELAFALVMQSRALHLQGATDEACQVWGEFIAFCQTSELNPEEVLG